MARIIPRNSGPEIVSVAERWFLDAVIQNLDDEFVVFHSVPWVHVGSQRLRQGECDFLILHPRLGIIAIETKPGDVRYDAMTGDWIRSDGKRLKSDPYIQAQRSVHSISELFSQTIKGWREQQFPFGYAVYFCGADQIKGQLPAHALPVFTLLQGDMPHLSQRLASIVRQFGEVPVHPQAGLIRAAISFLRPEFQLVKKVSTQLAMLEEDLQRLTKQQIQVLDLLKETRRLLVKGCAGSGKTILALEKAVRLAREGKQVLLLCYNIPLAEWLKAQIVREKLGVTVCHFHGMCQIAAKAAALPYPEPEDSTNKSEFFDNAAPALLEAAIRMGVMPQYDAIIVDEGQDFIAEWWILTEGLLKNPKEGLLYIFYDPEQNIFGRKFGFLIDEAKVTLDQICRNSRPISAFINRVAGTAHMTANFSLDGPLPEEYEVDSDKSELEKVEQIVRDLVHQKKISPERIVIVGSRRRSNTALANLETLAGIPLAEESTILDLDGKIRYATIFRFKGLESDCVILVGFKRVEKGKTDQMLYTAASRAKFLLYVVYRTDISNQRDA